MRFGLIGTGYWAREVHAAGIARHPGAELVGVWGRDVAKASAVASAYDARPYAELGALLADVDAVSFSVPPDVQADLAARVASAGKHVLLEKPLALGVADADAVVDAIDGAGVASVVFFTDRFVPQREEWLEAQRTAGRLGGRATWVTALQPGSPFFDSPWRHREGALWDVGPHALASLVPVLGPVRSVVGAHGAGDLVHLVFTHESGATSTCDLSSTMPPAAARVAVEFYGDDGWHARPDTARDAADAHRRAVDDLVALAGSGAEHRCGARFARDIVAVLEQAAVAIGDGEPSGSRNAV